MFYPFAAQRPDPDIPWNDERHVTVYYTGRIWEVREDEASDWLIFVRERRACPPHHERGLFGSVSLDCRSAPVLDRTQENRVIDDAILLAVRRPVHRPR